MTGDLYQSPLRHGATYEESSPDGVTSRPHWASLMQTLRELGPVELDRRWSSAERRIRENGTTYNVYGDPLGRNRPWQIDIVPLLIPAQEWRYIEQGVIQRAQLLSLLLQDLYGPQKLLLQGHFPAALLYGNPAFLRPLVGVPVPAHSYLHMLAVDLARSPDGQWWVLADRTQAPSGSGYALENRTIVSDLLPELFGNLNVLRLAPFFRAQRDALVSLAKNASFAKHSGYAGAAPNANRTPAENPRVVLLTPGPHNETYFEHSYLAKYLDLTLVEGADLLVRDRRVFLKTVGGLEPVDVILRRVDDTFCDPLELRGDSLLGVSGLVDAIVAGNVQVANALGSGLIETAAIMPFLPGLARHLLGEPLKLPSVATWWCGQGSALDWVVRHLDSVVVKPAFPAQGMEPVFGSQLPAAEKDKLVERLWARPHEYVAQEQVALSTAPVWENRSLSSRSVVLRTYVLNTGNGWLAIPGGLVRVAEANGSVVSMQRGGHSKDAWVLSDGAVDTFSLLRPRDEPVQLRRISSVVPSSVADNTFWLGRYVERAENLARILRCMLPRIVRGDPAGLAGLLRLHGCLGLRYSRSNRNRRKPASYAALEKEMLFLLGDTELPQSLPCTLAEVARIGGNVRERLSADMMLLIGQLRDSMQAAQAAYQSPGRSPNRKGGFEDAPAASRSSNAAAHLSDQQTTLTGCLELLSAFSGMERENINRGSGWLFMSIGRRLERAINLTRQLREITRPLPAGDWSFLERLLEVGDSSMTYRQRYYTTLQPMAVLDVLMADETNPRSLDFQLSHVADLYSKLPRHQPAELQAMQHALATFRSIDLQAVRYPFAEGSSPTGKNVNYPELGRLDRFLGNLANQLPAWSNNLSTNYFSHARTLPTPMGL